MIGILPRLICKRFIPKLIVFTTVLLLVLVVTKSQEFVELASLGIPFRLILLLISYQIPFILTFSLFFSLIICSFDLGNSLSEQREYGALLTLGIPKKLLIEPFVFLLLSLSSFSFFLVSELAPYCRFESKQIIKSYIRSHPDITFEKLSEKGKWSYIHIPETEYVCCLFPSSSGVTEIIAKKPVLSGNEIVLENAHMILQKDGGEVMYQFAKKARIAKTTLFSLYKHTKGGNPVDYMTSLQLLGNEKKKLYELFKRLFFLFAPFSSGLLAFSSALTPIAYRKKTVLLNLVVVLFLVFSSFLCGKSFQSSPLLSSLFFCIFPILPIPWVIYKLRSSS